MFKRECRAVTRLLWDYTQGRLTESTSDRVEIHIARCGRCRREHDTYKLTGALVSRYRREPEPESKTTWHALRTQLEHVQTTQPVELPGPSRRGSAVPAWMGTIAAGAIMAAVWTSFRTAEYAAEPVDLMDLKGGINSPLVSAPPAIEVGPMVRQNTESVSDAAATPGPKLQAASFRSDSPENDRNVPVAGTEFRESYRLRPEEQFELKSALTRRSPARREIKKQPVEPAESVSAMKREFVMGTIPLGSRIAPPSNLDSPEERPVW